LLNRVKQNIALIILGRLRTSDFQLLRYEKDWSITSVRITLWPDTYAFITSEVVSELNRF
jgi:hypothetical protein